MSYARNKRAKERRRNRTRIKNIEEFQKQRKEKLEKEILKNEEKIKTLIKAEEEEEEMGIILVHGAMTYECEKCGKTWKMWLEIGVEGKDKIMPCPFIIKCKCGGMAKHINWQNDIWLPEPRPLGENMSYFKLDKKGLKKKDSNACGIPVLR